jgi:hypothetical protein
MERSRGGVCRHGGSFPIAFRCAAISWFKLTHYQVLHELHVQGLEVSCDPFPKCDGIKSQNQLQADRNSGSASDGDADPPKRLVRDA